FRGCQAARPAQLSSPTVTPLVAEFLSLGAGAFDATTNAILRALLEPHQTLLKVGKSTGVLFGSVRSLVKGTQTVNDDGDQCLLADAVDAADFVDRTILDQNGDGLAVTTGIFRSVALSIEAGNLVAMTCASSAGLVGDGNAQ